MSANHVEIAIIGGNFAGLTTATNLSSKYQVSVIDPSPHFEWIPNIHELVSGTKNPQGLRLSRPEILENAGHAFIQDRVIHIDTAQSQLVLQKQPALHYEVCVVAMGGVSHHYGVAGVEAHASPFRSVEDCHAIELKLEDLLKTQEELSIVIVGAGISGIEALGEILRKHRQHLHLQIHVVEAASQILPGLPISLDQDIRQTCDPYPVFFHMGTGVDAISAGSVVLTSGATLTSHLTIWTAGVVPPQLLQESGLIRPPEKWAGVRQTLRSKYVHNIFVVGDAAELPAPISKQAYYAIEMGECAAENAKRKLQGRSLKRFHPSRKPLLIALGDLDTYMVAGDTVVASKLFAGAKEGIYQLYMARIAASEGLKSIKGIVERFGSGIKELVLPEFMSLQMFKEKRDCRILQLGSSKLT